MVEWGPNPQSTLPATTYTIIFFPKLKYNKYLRVNTSKGIGPGMGDKVEKLIEKNRWKPL